jgi:formate hydrogenlyase subunit 4
MLTLWLQTTIQVSGVLFLSPLISGILSQLKAKVESRRGPSIFQPYRDLRKFYLKEVTVPQGSSLFFVASPYFVFGVYLLISLVIPVILPFPTAFAPSVDFLGGGLLFALAGMLQVLAAIDAGSNFTILGASRSVSFSALAEPTLITVFFAVAFVSGTDNPYATENVILGSASTYFSVPHILSSIAFFMLLLFETGKLPLESSGLMELGMIDDARTYEYSGKALLLLKYSSFIKQYLLGSVFLNVFVFPWGLQTGLIGSLLDIPIMLVKWLVLITVIVYIEETFAKLRLFKVQDYLAISFALAILSLLSFRLGGVV